MQHQTDTQDEAKHLLPDDDPLRHPDVKWRKGRDHAQGWSFEPLIRVEHGTDLLEMLDRLRSRTSSDE